MSGSQNDDGLIIFGRDISKIPCFRSSYLYGIYSGLATGLVYFLFTSKPKNSTRVGVCSFGVVTMSYWFWCRYNYSKTKFEMQRLQELLRKHVLHEGTEKGIAAESADTNKKTV